ncbi:hypothetical protein OQA88_2592 [Cercophora sp. LCS_1]
MSAVRMTSRAVLRAARSQTTVRIQQRFATTKPGKPNASHVGDKGTTKVYNQDGTNPNKNLMYLALGALGLGGVYSMFMARRENVAGKGYQNDPDAVAHHPAEKNPAAK